MSRALRKGVAVVAASRAADPLEMTDPRSIAALLVTLGLGPREALDALSGRVETLVRRNRLKLEGKLMPGGVYRLDVGEDPLSVLDILY